MTFGRYTAQQGAPQVFALTRKDLLSKALLVIMFKIWGVVAQGLRRLCSLLLVALIFVVPLGWPSRAAAQDGAYGRLDGDLDLSASVGAGYAVKAPLLVARASAVYAQIAGVYLGYGEAFGQTEALVERSVAAGVSAKPLFWGRFVSALETGPARLDLFIDSLTFDIGAFWAAPTGQDFLIDPGIEIGASLGFPISAEATGLWIECRGALRFPAADMASGVARDIGVSGAMVSLSLAWHHVLGVHIVDAGDRLVR